MIRTTTCCCAAALLLGLTAPTHAQVTNPQTPPASNQPNVQQDNVRQQQNQQLQQQNANQLQRQEHSANRIETPATMRTMRASGLIGKGIENPRGESVGSVSDFVLDPTTGKIRYVAVTYGGFLGIGDKMFAVPYEAFAWKVDADNRDAQLLVLDVNQQQLEGATGFDQNNWPNFADATFTSDLDRRYRIQRNVETQQLNQDRPNVDRPIVPAPDANKPDVDIDVNREGIDVDVDRNNPATR